MALQNKWFRQVQRRPWRTQRQATALATLSVFIAIIIGALYLAQVAALSTTGRQLEDLISIRNELQQTNEQMRVEIANLRSVPRLLARAQELGFSSAAGGSIEYMVVEGYNPNRVNTAESLLQPVEETLPEYDESFDGWVRLQWDTFQSQLNSFVNREG
jgi:hypothetical protein